MLGLARGLAPPDRGLVAHLAPLGPGPGVTDTDWDFLLDTALMHHTMWAKARWEFAAELRLRAAKFGATPEDRMRLRLTVQTPGEQPKEQAGSPAEVTARRRNLHIAG